MRKEDFITFMESEICLSQEQCRKLAEQKAAAQSQGNYDAVIEAVSQLQTVQSRLAYWEEYKIRNPGLYTQNAPDNPAG